LNLPHGAIIYIYMYMISVGYAMLHALEEIKWVYTNVSSQAGLGVGQVLSPWFFWYFFVSQTAAWR
jgi:hypothetical protein